MIRAYSELIKLDTFEERFRYLKIGGTLGQATFGFHRYLNQLLYTSNEWRSFREEILIRDGGLDLGVAGREIYSHPIIHHLNPITMEDIERGSPRVFDSENVITTLHRTHNAIHYGDESLLFVLPRERRKGDTCLWTASSQP